MLTWLAPEAAIAARNRRLHALCSQSCGGGSFFQIGLDTARLAARVVHSRTRRAGEATRWAVARKALSKARWYCLSAVGGWHRDASLRFSGFQV